MSDEEALLKEAFRIAWDEVQAGRMTAKEAIVRLALYEPVVPRDRKPN